MVPRRDPESDSVSWPEAGRRLVLPFGQQESPAIECDVKPEGVDPALLAGRIERW
jgi:hypothetical protein